MYCKKYRTVDHILLVWTQILFSMNMTPPWTHPRNSAEFKVDETFKDVQKTYCRVIYTVIAYYFALRASVQIEYF